MEPLPVRGPHDIALSFSAPTVGDRHFPNELVTPTVVGLFDDSTANPRIGKHLFLLDGEVVIDAALTSPAVNITSANTIAPHNVKFFNSRDVCMLLLPYQPTWKWANFPRRHNRTKPLKIYLIIG